MLVPMIDDAIEYVRQEVRDYLGLTNQEVITDHIYLLKDKANAQGVFLSLVNLEEETVLRNTSHVTRQVDAVRYQQPPVYLNLYLLFACRFQAYPTSLMNLAKIVELFQSKRVLSPATAGTGLTFPATLEKLIFDVHNLNLEQLNYLWSILGGAYLPSVLYKVRLVKVQADITAAAPEITAIQLDTVQQ